MKRKKKILSSNSREDLVSMVLGLVIVGVVVGLIFNFVQRGKGSVSVPGISNQISLTDGVTVTPMALEQKETKNTKTYRVKKGDNLWDISVEVYGDGYKWVDVAKENGLANPDLLSVGQELKLLSVESPSVPSGEYVVKTGDNLWKISLDLYGDGFKWVDIWNQNKKLILNPNVIEVGMKLALP